MWFVLATLLILSPIALGGGYFVFEFAKEEFYKDALYDDYKH